MRKPRGRNEEMQSSLLKFVRRVEEENEVVLACHVLSAPKTTRGGSEVSLWLKTRAVFTKYWQ